MEVDTTTVKSYTYDEFKTSFSEFDYKVHQINVIAAKNDVFKHLDDVIISSVVNNRYFDRIKSLTNENLNRTDSLLRQNLGQIDSLRKASNDTTGRFFEVQDLVRGRYLYRISAFSSAFDALKNWTNHEWKDSLLTKNDWLILHELYSQKMVKDSSYVKNLEICEDNLLKYFPKDIDTATETITTKKDTIR